MFSVQHRSLEAGVTAPDEMYLGVWRDRPSGRKESTAGDDDSEERGGDEWVCDPRGQVLLLWVLGHRRSHDVQALKLTHDRRQMTSVVFNDVPSVTWPRRTVPKSQRKLQLMTVILS